MRPLVALAMAANKTLHVFDEPLLDRLSLSCDIVSRTPLESLTSPEAKAILRDTDILVTGWGCPFISREVLANAPKLRLIAHAAGTVKSLIDPSAYEAGITITNATDANAVPVAEFTLAAIIFSGKHVFRFRDLYRADTKRHTSHALMDEPIGNLRRTIGLVGASKIGRRVAKLLEPFDYTILLYDPFVRPDDPITSTAQRVDLHTLLTRSDIVSIHAPSLPSTRGMIGAAELERMRDGTTLINTARGALIDEAALIAELETGRISAVIDVTDPEIPPSNSALFRLPNVFLTPHIAGAVGSERLRLGQLVVDEIERFVAYQPLQHAIEPALLERLA